MSKPVIAWSHSALESFETCPQKHYRTRIAKDVEVDWSGDAVTWGRKVHEALDRRMRLGATLPANMSQYEPYAAKLEALSKRTGLEIHTELQLAVDQKLKPCGWKDWNNCWGRAALDVVLMDADSPSALVLDWKTGKRKMSDQQLVIQAVMTFLHFPHIDTVTSGFVWLKEGGAMDKLTFSRADLKKLLKSFLPKVRQLTDAVIAGEWQPRPSGLCANHCEVVDCRFNGAHSGPKQ